LQIAKIGALSKSYAASAVATPIKKPVNVLASSFATSILRWTFEKKHV